MSGEKKGNRKTKATPPREPGHGAVDRDVGHALRSVYAKTVNEDIPPELLDLLGKLS